MEVSRYHKFLRVSAVLVATVLVFDGGFLSPITKELSDNTIVYLSSAGSSGVKVSVPENEINRLTAQISEQKRELDQREAQLEEREIAARVYESSEETDYSTYILSIILFILTVLIVTNYILDWNRVRLVRYEKASA